MIIIVQSNKIATITLIVDDSRMRIIDRNSIGIIDTKIYSITTSAAVLLMFIEYIQIVQRDFTVTFYFRYFISLGRAHRRRRR